jgi:hypothetical protein
VNTPSPVLISQQAVRRFPRIALIGICLLYVMAGLTGHDPWKRIDVASFGYMWSLAQNQSTYLNLQLAGIAPEFKAYLPYWLGAWSIQWTQGWLLPEVAVRLPFSLLSLLSMALVWNGTYHLARNPQAQPVAFAFGGEAQPKDYARSLADAGLLANLACLGLALPSHETTPMAMQLYGAAALFAGACALAYFPIRALAAWSCGLLLMTMSGAPSLAFILALGSVFLWFKHPQSNGRQISMMVLIMFILAMLILGLDLWQWRILSVHELTQQWRQKTELLMWFLWPAWPLAAWTLWRWRGHWRSQVWSQHLIMPLLMFVVTLIASLLTNAPEKTLLLALPSLAALAAFALPTLSRSVAALIDWFTLLFFSGCALIMWVVWLSLQTGFPAQPALNVERLVPGFIHSFDVMSFSVALMVTAVWLKLVHWRIGRHPSAIWKSLVLPASGATLCWVLLMTLWLPILDRALSYRPWAHQLSNMMQQPHCVYAQDLERNQLAGLSYHGNFQFIPLTSNAPKTCSWLMTRRSWLQQQADQDLSGWTLAFVSKRPADKNEEIVIFQRKPL